MRIALAGIPQLAERIGYVSERIAGAAGRAGRRPEDIALVAVTKTHGPQTVAAAYRAGLRIFGENRTEEAQPKAAALMALLGALPPPNWHMIGHVQSRKVRDVVTWASMVHSLDSEKLARRLSDRCVAAGMTMPVLLEVNVSGEVSKYGLAPAALPQLVETLLPLPGLRLDGLMTVAPIAASPEHVRPVFATLRRLRDDLAARYPEGGWRQLSMGMSDDYEVAIEEGATMVRLGRALFGERVCLE
jgi:pyridoxal phosphate enzyme (YggS family)